MFEGEETRVFWIGLVMLASASLALFVILWWTLIVWERFDWKIHIPQVLGAVVFMLVGFYMMKSGVKKPHATGSAPKTP